MTPIERPATNSRLFAHTRWDAIPALASLLHLAYFFALFFLYPHLPLGVMLTAQTLREDLLLGVAASLEQAMPWLERRPAVDAGASSA